MPWGRIDDGFYDHPKLDGLGRDRLPAVGLHWLAVSWCNRWLTDGHLTTERVIKLGGSVRLADLLVAVGLWERADTGYLIHDFLDFNDSRADTEAKRAAERDKKRDQRARGAAVSTRGDGGRFVASRGVSPDVSPGDTDRTPRGSPPLPVLSRPDPTRPDRADTGRAPDDETARHGLPHLTAEVAQAAETATGRSITTLHGTWATELDRLVEDRGAERAVVAIVRAAESFPERPSWAQLVAKVRNLLEPLPGSERVTPPKAETPQEFARRKEREWAEEDARAARS